METGRTDVEGRMSVFKPVLWVLVASLSLPVFAAKLPPGTPCTAVKPMLLFKKAKGKQRVTRLQKGATLVLGKREGRRFQATLSDGRIGFISGKLAHRICDKPSTSEPRVCIVDRDLPLFARKKGKKRKGKVNKGVELTVGSSFRYRSNVVLEDGREAFIPKKKLAAFCTDVVIATPIVPLKPDTQAQPATPAQPSHPTRPGTPASPKTPANAPKAPHQPTMTVPVVALPDVPGVVVTNPTAPKVGQPGVAGPIAPVVAVPPPPKAATSAAQGKAKSSDKTRKEGDTSGESSDKNPKGETREAEPASEN